MRVSRLEPGEPRAADERNQRRRGAYFRGTQVSEQDPYVLFHTPIKGPIYSCDCGATVLVGFEKAAGWQRRLMLGAIVWCCRSCCASIGAPNEADCTPPDREAPERSPTPYECTQQKPCGGCAACYR